MKMWIEMSRDEEHGGNEWGFTKCIWAPTYKNSEENKIWPFWENVKKVRAGDIVFHLRGKGKYAKFVGFSIVKSDGHKTTERPQKLGDWEYCTSFYRAFLRDYMNFSKAINLYDLFRDKEIDFKRYYEQKVKPRNIFYTIQSNRLQCLNGGYLSEADEILLEIIFGDTDEFVNDQNESVELLVNTSIAVRQIKARIGHARFAENVKDNYNSQCCFPECGISDRDFLIASHIARWADNSEKRGNTSNGLCLCPIHDRAFELGCFSLDDNFRICVGKKNNHIQMYNKYIAKYIGMMILKGNIEPDREALAEHRKRNNIFDTSNS